MIPIVHNVLHNIINLKIFLIVYLIVTNHKISPINNVLIVVLIVYNVLIHLIIVQNVNKISKKIL